MTRLPEEAFRKAGDLPEEPVMSDYENTYDEQTGIWTTAADRYEALLRSRPEYVHLGDRIRDDPEGAWMTLLELVGEIAEADTQVLDMVGAGPIEDFVKCHAESYIGRIEAEAAVNARFLRSLARIWLSEGHLPEDVTDRLLRVTGGAIPIFPPSEPHSDET